jgi:hypothetical protein
MRLCSGQGTLRWLRRPACVCAWFRWLLKYVPAKEWSILLWNGAELILVFTVLISCWKSSLVLFSEAWEALVINRSVSDPLAQSSGWRIEPCGRIMGFWLNVGWGVKVTRRWMFGWVALNRRNSGNFMSQIWIVSVAWSDSTGHCSQTMALSTTQKRTLSKRVHLSCHQARYYIAFVKI